MQGLASVAEKLNLAVVVIIAIKVNQSTVLVSTILHIWFIDLKIVQK